MQASQYKPEIASCPIFNVHQCDPYWYWQSFLVFNNWKLGISVGALGVVKNPNKKRLFFHLKNPPIWKTKKQPRIGQKPANPYWVRVLEGPILAVSGCFSGTFFKMGKKPNEIRLFWRIIDWHWCLRIVGWFYERKFGRLAIALRKHLENWRTPESGKRKRFCPSHTFQNLLTKRTSKNSLSTVGHQFGIRQ